MSGSLDISTAKQGTDPNNAQNPIKSVVKTIDDTLKSVNGVLGTAVSAVDGTFNSREQFNKLRDNVAKKYGIDSALETLDTTMGLVKSFEAAFKGTPNDGSPKANYSQITQVSKYQYPSDLGGIYLQISLKEWKKLSAFGKNTMDTKAAISLPLPRNLVENYNVEYKTTSLGALVGGMKQQAVGAATGDATNFRKRLELSLQTEATESLLLGAEGLGMKAAEALPVGISEGAANVVKTLKNFSTEVKEAANYATEQSLGLAYNPNLTLVLGGPQLRTHQFTWTLAAKNFKESKAIKEIIQELRKAMLPSSADGFIYKYPNYALIRIHPKNEFMYKFKPCVITGLSVNYSGAGYPSFMPGESAGNHPPTIIELTIAFQEVEAIIRENVESGDEFLSSATVGGDTVEMTFPGTVVGALGTGLSETVGAIGGMVDSGIRAGIDIIDPKGTVDRISKTLRGDS